MPISATNPFKGRQYPGEVILQAVRWYLRYPLEAYPEEEFSLEAGDRLLIYTDGLVEATSPDDLEFGEVRLEESIRRHTHLSADQFAGQLLEEVLTWPEGGNKHAQSDDITIVVIDVER